MSRSRFLQLVRIALAIVAAWLAIGVMTWLQCVVILLVDGVDVGQSPTETFTAVFGWALLTP
ncbi:MAG TPA: hypothetical protein VFN10_15420, partial [Thermoanaerobaculia bacterium]|nr:hypothetical protein [Thermoanaerobaculia bacterium]